MVEQPVKTIGATAEEKKKAQEAEAEAEERGWSCYKQLYDFKITTRDGDVIVVQAFDKSAAEKKAIDAGYKPAWVTKKMGWETIEPTSKATGAYTVTKEDGSRITMLPFKDTETGDTHLMPQDTAKELMSTDAYKEAKGSEEAKLGIALSSTQREFDNWLNDLKHDHPHLYEIYSDKGYDAMVEAVESQNKQQQTILSKLAKYQEGDKYDLYTALTDEAVTPQDLRGLGFENSDIKAASIAVVETTPRLMTKLLPDEEWEKLEKEFTSLPKKKFLAGFPGIESQEWYIHENSWLSDYKIPDKPYDELTKEQQKDVLAFYATNNPEYWAERAKATGKVALAFVPIAGTIAYWNDMSPALKAISVATDILIVSYIAKAAAAGARATKGYTAAARMKGALTGAGQAVLAEVTAPVDLLAHPIDTAKGIGRQIQSAVETFVHPGKIPLGSAELTYTTARIPVKDVGGAKQAMELRDAAVAAAIKGKPATAKVGDISLTLNPSELQKVGGAMAIHQTPDVRPFLNGAVVKGGAEGSGLFISPNFHSRFAQATAFGDMPEGGIKGGLIIRDKSVLNVLAPSGKTYMGTAEVEAILKPGTVLPAPSQVLFTRDVSGNKLALLVIGEPFTQSQVAKLKVLGSIDTIGQIFKPTIKITGAEKTAINAMDDIIELSQERATLARQLEAARAAGRTSVAQELAQKITRLDDRINDLVRKVNTPRDIIRPDDLAWGEYTERGLIDRYQEVSPGKATKTARGTRLRDTRPARVIGTAASLRGRIHGNKYEPYIAAEYDTQKTPAYAPVDNPRYVPVKTPPYAPLEPPRIAPPTPPRYPPSRTPPRVPPPSGPPTTPKRTRTGITLTKGERLIRPGESLVSWRQGAYWITLVEPYRTTGNKPDVIYSRSKPPWAKPGKGRLSPQRTLRALGKRHPKSMKVPMGVVTAHVRNGRKLSFRSQ